MSDFVQEYDTILSEILTDLGAQFPDEGISVGDPLYVQATTQAAIKWSLQKAVEFALFQRFVDTANRENLEKLAFEYGIELVSGESTDDLRVRVKSNLRDKPAGGTGPDFEREAEKVAGVQSAKILGPEVEGAGSVGVVILSALPTGVTTSVTANKLIDNTLSQFTSDMFNGSVPRYCKNNTTGLYAKITGFDSTSKLALDSDIFLAAGDAYTVHYRIPSAAVVTSTDSAIDDFRPITSTANVRAADIGSIQNIIMAVTGDANISDTILGIDAYVNNLKIGEPLLVDQLKVVALNSGADTATVTSPSSDIAVNADAVILLGSVTVT